jgi:hypothetical protein
MQGLERVVDGDLDALIGPNKLTTLPTLRCVQPTGNGPLNRAFQQMASTGADASTAAKSRPDFMTPWSDPHSLATGILDDETYDWVEVRTLAHAHKQHTAKNTNARTLVHTRTQIRKL